MKAKVIILAFLQCGAFILAAVFFNAQFTVVGLEGITFVAIEAMIAIWFLIGIVATTYAWSITNAAEKELRANRALAPQTEQMTLKDLSQIDGVLHKALRIKADSVGTSTSFRGLVADKALVVSALAQAPSLFTALGIFFTFYGLVQGLANLDLSSNTETLQASFARLLPAVGIAFQSSLVGVGMSGLSLLLSKTNSVGFRESRRHLQEILEEYYLEETPDRILGRMEIRLQQISDHVEQLPAQIQRIPEALGQLGIGVHMQTLVDEVKLLRSDQFELHRDALDTVMQNMSKTISLELRETITDLRQELNGLIRWTEEERRIIVGNHTIISEYIEQQREIVNSHNQYITEQKEIFPHLKNLQITNDHILTKMSLMANSFTAASEAWPAQILEMERVRTQFSQDTITVGQAVSHEVRLSLESIDGTLSEAIKLLAESVEMSRVATEQHQRAMLAFDSNTNEKIVNSLREIEEVFGRVEGLAQSLGRATPDLLNQFQHTVTYAGTTVQDQLKEIRVDLSKMGDSTRNDIGLAQAAFQGQIHQTHQQLQVLLTQIASGIAGIEGISPNVATNIESTIKKINGQLQVDLAITYQEFGTHVADIIRKLQIFHHNQSQTTHDELMRALAHLGLVLAENGISTSAGEVEITQAHL